MGLQGPPWHLPLTRLTLHPLPQGTESTLSNSISQKPGCPALVWKCRGHSHMCITPRPLKSFLRAPHSQAWVGIIRHLRVARGTPACARANCVLGLEPQHLRRILPPLLSLMVKELRGQVQCPPGTVQGACPEAQRSILLGGSHCRGTQELEVRCGHLCTEPPQPYRLETLGCGEASLSQEINFGHTPSSKLQ